MEKGVGALASVTRRIKDVRQPRLGYIPVATLNVVEYFDRHRIEKIDSYYKPIQGMAVDYLTRFMNGSPKHTAFQISLMGAEKVDELDKAKRLLDTIKGLDEKSIRAACQLVGYDVAFRRGPQYFTPVERIIPDKKVIQNIVVLVNRSLAFLKNNGPVVLDGFTFEGGYNDIIDSGDGDYLTADTLWDFKVSESKPEINHTLQVLVYYILGIHSIHKEFQATKKLGIYNPELNTSYTISLSEISDEVFYNVSQDVIGYCMPDGINQWRNATGTSEKALNELLDRLKKEFKDTGFSPDKYSDGIHDISIDDYWSYYQKITTNSRPKFVRTHSVKFIKNSGFIMFVSISEKGTASILEGGSLSRIKRPLQYYYEKLPEYANAVLSKFSRYWDALYSISKQIQSVIPNDKEIKDRYKGYVLACKKQNGFILPYEAWREICRGQYTFSGKVHGCIIDIDYSNHIYLNPYDGSIAPYSAPSKYMKYVYKNVPSLIAEQRPEMRPAFNRAVDSNTDKETTELVLADAKEKRMLSVLEQHEIDTYNVPVTDTKMYDVSDRMTQLQKIYDHHLVVVWYDNVLPNYELPGEQKAPQPLTVGETKTMNCGMSATVLADNGYKDVTVQFEDGTIVENCLRDKFREGKITNPSLRQEKAAPKVRKEPREKSYVGKTAVMNCGLRATVIEDFGCNDITIQFEDGLIKKHCRRDKFRDGNIGHKA